MFKKIIFSIVCLFAASLTMVNVNAQISPGRAVHLITGETGGVNDFAARLIAPGMSADLGTSVVVDNRGGASGIIAANGVVRATPDGHTLLLYGNPTWLLQFLRDDVPYDIEKDLLPVSLVLRSPNLLVVHPSVPVESVKALIELAKSKPGSLNYAATGSGTANHLAAELFKTMAGVELVKITYKGTSAAMTALLRGEAHLMFATIAAVTPQIKAGKLRALAVTSAQASPLLPGVPAFSASGLPGYESGSAYGIFAPAATPTPTVNALSRSVATTLKKSDVSDKLTAAGVEPVGSSPRDFAELIKTERNRLGKVIKDAGIRDDSN